MNLYLLSTTNWDYDEYDSILIRADSEKTAREIAQKQDKVRQFYDKDFWLNNGHCDIITANGPTGIVISSFNAG